MQTIPSDPIYTSLEHRLALSLASGWRLVTIAFSACLLAAITGCHTAAPTSLDIPENVPETNVVLRAGDTLKITFPGTPALESQQQLIRRDGKITLPSFGDLQASGLTTTELEKEVLKAYDTQLVNKEVMVTLVGSPFPVYVTGAVLSPGKKLSDHPMTVIEAIVEASGFNASRADMKRVVIIRRQDDGTTKSYRLNLQPAMSGVESKPFYLKPYDIVHVPEKFQMF
jgi:polysaccharide biosynthesis/export protein